MQTTLPLEVVYRKYVTAEFSHLNVRNMVIEAEMAVIGDAKELEAVS